jgi:hypothetical protein
MRFELAGAADDVEIRRLLRENALQGDVRLTFECEPDSFVAGAVQGERHQVIVARDTAGGRVYGMGSRTILDAWVNGRATRIGYLSQLRVDRHHRERVRRIRDAYAYVRTLHGDGEAPFYVTTIVEHNLPARRLLEANLPGMPRYRAAGRLVTLALPLRPRRARGVAGVRVERASAGALDAIADCLERYGVRHQFAPRWTAATLRDPRRCHGLEPHDFLVARRRERVVGCLACWDQRSYKQTIVRGYARRLGLVRPAINLVGPWFGVAKLPRPGSQVRNVFLSHVAIDDDDQAVLASLVDAAMNVVGRDGADYLVTGFAEGNPLLDAVRGTYSCRPYTSILYTVCWTDGAGAVEALDGRVPHLEVAIL